MLRTRSYDTPKDRQDHFIFLRTESDDISMYKIKRYFLRIESDDTVLLRTVSHDFSKTGLNDISLTGTGSYDISKDRVTRYF